MTVAETIAARVQAGKNAPVVQKPEQIGSKQCGFVTVRKGAHEVEFFYSYDRPVGVRLCIIYTNLDDGSEIRQYGIGAIDDFRWSNTTNRHKREAFGRWEAGGVTRYVTNEEFMARLDEARCHVGLNHFNLADFRNASTRHGYTINRQTGPTASPDMTPEEVKDAYRRKDRYYHPY